MEYFRRFLIQLRIQDNKVDEKVSFRRKLLIVSFIGVIIGFILDISLPFSFLFNGIRGIIAVISSVSIFSLLHLILIDYKNQKIEEDQYYNPIRKRFSFNQRFNLSILISIVVFIFIMFSNNPSPIYSLKANISIIIIIFAIAFARRDRNEFIKDIYKIPDIRDLNFNKEKTNKIGKIDIDN